MRWLYTVMAQANNNPLKGSEQELGIPTTAADTAALATILDMVYMIAAVVAVIVVVVAGIQYSTSTGDPQSVTRAKNAIIYAIAGLVVVAMAFVITSFVLGRF